MGPETRPKTSVQETDGAPARVLAEAREELARLPKLLRILVESLDDATWRAHPAPGRWSPLEIVCHLRDEEADDFGARLKVILEGKSEFAPIDPEAWVVARRYGDDDPRRAIAAFEARRRENLELLGRVDASLLERAGSSGRTRLTGLDVLAAWVAHDLLHLRQLAGTLARLWATRWDSLQSAYAGPLPYPPGESKS